MSKKLFGLLVGVLMALCIAGCSSNSGSNASSSTGVDYADDEAMQVIAEGWNARSAAVENLNPSDSDYATRLKDAVQIELDSDSPLKDRQFENTEMQEDVISYINSLEDQIDVLNNYSMTDLDFYDKWNKAYDERSVLLKKFVEEYGLTVDSKYQSALDDILANGNSTELKDAQKDAIDSLIANAQWEKTESYGSYTYTAVVENTTDYDFKDMTLLVNLYDADNVKNEAYANASSWKKGDKVKLEAYSDVDAQRVEAEVQYFTVDEG